MPKQFIRLNKRSFQNQGSWKSKMSQYNRLLISKFLRPASGQALKERAFNSFWSENVQNLHPITKGVTSSQESRLRERERLSIFGYGKARRTIEWKSMSSLQHGQFTVISLSGHNTLETGRLKHEMGIMFWPALTSGLFNPAEIDPYKVWLYPVNLITQI